jgi:molybdate transport system substrate-binding protein
VHRAGLIGLVVALSAVAPSSAQRAEVLVSAATSLTDVLRQIAPLYEARTGTRLILNAAGSNTLARQIAAGAPVDLFLSADEAQMDVVGDQIVAGTRVDLLSNQLAIAVPADRPRVVRSAQDLAGPAFGRIALGDPAAVPAGVYARQYLQQLGLWSRIEPKVVPSGSVRLALAAVEHGAADAAIVYRTDVATARRASLAFVVPRAEGPPIVYPAAVVRDARNADGARRLLAFLQGREASAIFARAGFIPLAAKD